ncbi:MAG: sulfurtransferase [Leptolyngbyaceae cyanobacterium bins.59]|nr:sulfurtransferase [Leptolyngbyaceae cyanobacterium bins.59]
MIPVSPIVSSSWLHEHLFNSNIVLVDCRFSLMQPDLGREQYQLSHLPGAFYLDLNRDLSGPVELHGGRHPLPDPQVLAEKLTALGVRSRTDESATHVVVYDDSRFAFAARLWWLLRYLGHDRVSVLDGGFTGWQEAGYSVTAEIPFPQPGYFVPKLRPEMVVDIEQVKARKDLPGVVLVDSREGERYRGEREPIDPIAGHIPGSVNYPWQEVSDAKGYVRSNAEQTERWAFLKEAQEVLLYCGSGVTACVNLLSMELTGITNARLYAGSWSDWCSYLTE